MTKIALVLALVAIGEGAVTLHLVNQLREERESAKTLQARVSELERKVPQAAGATFVAVPRQPTVSPFTVASKDSARPSPPPQAIAGVFTSSDAPAVSSVMTVAAPDQERMRDQMKQSMERQAALLRDPEYREAMLAQQKVGARQSNPNLARDLGLTADQADRLFSTLAEQQLRSMENTSGLIWDEQRDPAKMQELQRKMMDQQRANEAELKRVLGETKFREYQEYQSLAGVRWEADRVRTALANAGVPLEDSLAKPLLKTLQAEQQKMMEQMASAVAPAAQNIVVARAGFISDSGAPPNMIEMQEKSLEFMTQHQKRQREALARVLTPEQLRVLEDEHNNELQMQRAQLRMIRAQQEAGLLDQSGNSVDTIQESVSFAPSPAN